MLGIEKYSHGNYDARTEWRSVQFNSEYVSDVRTLTKQSVDKMVVIKFWKTFRKSLPGDVR